MCCYVSALRIGFLHMKLEFYLTVCVQWSSTTLEVRVYSKIKDDKWVLGLIVLMEYRIRKLEFAEIWFGRSHNSTLRVVSHEKSFLYLCLLV